MILRKKLHVLLYIIQIFCIFGNGEIEKKDKLDLNNETENLGKFPEETTELALEENIISDGLEENSKSAQKKKLNVIENVNVIDTTSDSITISWPEKSDFVPFHQIEWFHDDFSDYGYKISNLSIYNITQLESCSHYKIQISEGIEKNDNPSKILEASTKNCAPHPVEHLKIESTKDSLNVSWAPPKGSNKVKKYFVQIFKDKNTSIFKGKTKNLFHHQENLESCTNYEVVVKALGEKDEDESPEKKIKSTTKPVKPGVVENLKLVEFNETWANISWGEPKINRNCIKEYQLEIVTHEKEVFTTKNLFYNFDKLKSCTKYQISVKAIGENEDSEKKFLTVTTKASKLYEVKELTTNAEKTSINITWIPPSENKECVISYSVLVLNSTNNQTVLETNTRETFFNAIDLLPCVKYTIVVKSLGDSNSSDGINTTVSTKLVKPSKPRYLTDNTEMEKALKIFWRPPEFGASCVKEYRVTLNTGTTSPITKSTNETQILFEGLNACTSYSVQINAVDVENGDSDLERILNTNCTKASFALPPIRAKTPVTTNDSVTLFWYIGNDNNCTLKKVVATCIYDSSEGIGHNPVNGTGESSEVITDQLFRKSVVVKVSNLNPFTSYNCQAITINELGPSNSSSSHNVMTLEDVPSDPVLNLLNVTDLEYSFNWTQPKIIPGKIKTYEISFSWEHLFPVPDKCNPLKAISSEIDGSLSNYTHQKGSPFSNYTARIRAETGAGFGNYSEPVYFTSESGVPSAVTNLTYKHEGSKNDSNILSTILKWGLPCELNGEIEYFNISVHGVRNNSEDHNFIRLFEIGKEVHKDDVFMKDLEELKPAYEYTFTLTTKVKNATKLGAGASYSVMYPAGIPVQPGMEYVKMLAIDPQKAIRTTTSATVLLPLFPETNGDIQFYAVMVSTMGKNKATSGRHEIKGNDWPNASCWQESMLQDFEIPYQATSPLWNPFPNYVIDYGHIKAVKFTLGQDTDCKELSINTDSRLYCNGPLKPGTFYHVRMRAFTNGGYADSAAFIVKTNSELNIPIIIGVVIGIMVLGILTTMMLLVKRCSLQAVLRRFLHSDLPGSPVPTPFTRRKFISHCQQLADNPGKLSCEFQLLQTLSLDLQMPTNAACLQANRKKNRYSDILPYDFSRVKLEVIDNDPNTDYINASFITGYNGEDEYIACQGPKEETTYDFWRMIDQYDVKIIVMLTQLFEKGKEKCHQYFPVIRETFNYEKMSIRCTSELDYRTCTQRTLVLQKDEQKRTIMHFHFKDWPDHDVPEDFDPMINFCQIMRRHISANKGLVVIHCSAGIGRTGTLISIDMLLQSIRDNRKLDVFGTVYRLRRHRLNMVQRESQYAYIYNCIRQVLKNPYILKNYKPPPVDLLNKNNKKKKDSANSSLELVTNLDWRKGSISLSADSMEPMYQSSPSSTLDTPKSNGLRCSKSMSALDPKVLETRVVKTSSQGYVTYESVKNSSFDSSNGSLVTSDLQGSRKSIYENVRPLFRSKSDQLLDANDLFLSRSNHYDSKEEPLEKDTSL